MIPHVFHRIWLGGPIPAEFAAFGRTWPAVNPGWELREWGADDITTMGLANQALWDAAPTLVAPNMVHRMRSDIARVEILERHGGIYVDTDFEALAPIGPLLHGVEAFGVEEKPGLVANGLMGCTPGHPLMAAMRETMPASVAARPGLPPWRTTGPEHLTRCIEAVGGITLLPTELFYPYHHSNLGRTVRIPAGTVAHHVWASARRQVSVVIPWRPGCAHREASLTHVIATVRDAHPEWQVMTATDDGEGPWCKAQAIRNGIADACGDVLAILDGDLVAPGLAEAVDLVARTGGWAMPYSTLHRLDADATADVLAGAEPHVDMGHDEAPYAGVIGGGAVVVDRVLAEQVPPDVRFRGWGGEDESWGYALDTLGGRLRRIDAPLFHLWHPPQERMSRDVGNPENHRLWERYNRAYRAKGTMRRLVAESMGGPPAGEPVPDGSRVTWRHTTGRLRIVDVGSHADLRMLHMPEWERLTPTAS